MKRTQLLYLVMLLTASLGIVESLFVRPTQAQQQTFTFVVTTTADNGDNTAPTPGSLREAVIFADPSFLLTIKFNIPAGDPNCNPTTKVCTITPPAPLPNIDAPVIVDGYSQPGTRENTSGGGTNAILRIEINGTSAGGDANGLTIVSSGCNVKGLVINRFSNSGIRLQSGSNEIEGNFIGTDATGTIDLGNFNGISLVAANNNLIGKGIFTRNLISGNGTAINFFSGGGNSVKGNLIGTTANGVTALHNSVGVRLNSTSSNNTIGSTRSGDGNIIAFNTAAGIQVVGNSAGNTIRGNSIHSNQGITGTGLGIDLGNESITFNDTLDADTGTNNFQNFPDLFSATAGGNTTIKGRLNSAPNAAFNIDFYSNAVCDVGYGEGESYIGSTTAITNSRGTATFSATFTRNVTGKIITATATDSANNTSEFSGCLAAGAPTTIQVTTTEDNGNDGAPTPGSMRAAFNDSNNLGGLKTIIFNIPASDPNCSPTTNVCTIQLAAPLQTLTAPVVIDGWSQGVSGYTGSPLIELNSSLKINAGSSIVQGLIIKSGIILQTFGGNTIRGNYIGTDTSGLNHAGNANGIIIHTPENVIGGTNAAARNLISGSRSSGILIQTFQGQGNIIQGNYIGTDINGENGSGLMGNLIYGIRIDTIASNNTIGGTQSGAGNLIAFNGFNGGAGIHVNNGAGNTIRGNSIRNNPGLGIDLGDGLVTANDPVDADAGGNNLQNFPVINSANRISGGNTHISGTLNSTPGTGFALDFFSNTACNSSGNGEGATYLGSITVTTDNGGNASFNQIFPTASNSQFITATATNTTTGDTSEFSACSSISSSGILTISGQVTFNGNALQGVSVSLSGSTTGATTTDSAGSFSFADLTAGGNYTVTPSLANYTFAPASATFNNLAANQTASFTATQCTYSLSANGVNAPAAGNTASFMVTAPSGCNWNAATTDSWITITNGSPGNGDGTVSYSVAANDGIQRTGTISVAGQSFLITQSGATSSISGTVSYGTNQSKFVSGVVISAGGANSPSTNSSGAYLLENLTTGGNYTVTASKTGDINGISPFDATLVLRCVAAGLNCTLTANQKLAADTNGGGLSPFDATLILRYVAAGRQTTNTGQVGNWIFSPASINHSALNDPVSGANYTAILVGEVNGDWRAPNSLAEIAEAPAEREEKESANLLRSEDSSVVISTPSTDVIEWEHQQPEITGESETTEDTNSETTKTAEIRLSLRENASTLGDGVVTIPVDLTKTANKQISAYSFAVRFDPNVLQPELSAVETKDSLSSNGFTIITDTNLKGRIGIAASALNNSVTSSGTLLYLRFRVVGSEKDLKSAAMALSFETSKKHGNRIGMFEDLFGNRISSVSTNSSLIVVTHNPKE